MLPKKTKKSPLVWAEVDLKQLQKNLKAIQRHASKDGRTQVLAVVKADAYGHGMIPVAKALWSSGVRFFGVANIDEASDLRSALPRARILVLGSFSREQAPLYIQNQIIPTISSLEDALNISSAAGRKAYSVHVKIDTGMSRLGIWHEEASTFFEELKKIPNVKIEGFYTHFAKADTDASHTRQQMRFFLSALHSARKAGLDPRFVHAANSMGSVRFKGVHCNLIRPGILLYGIHPSLSLKLPFTVKPILQLKTKISFLKTIQPGRSVSYGATYKAKRLTTVATIPVGYSHGYRVAFSNKAFILVRGINCPVIGRVTMDQTLADVSLAKPRRWEEAVLIGRSGKTSVSASDLASLASTIPYEIVCGLHSRIPRVYKGI